jgi:hypothetical protein
MLEFGQIDGDDGGSSRTAETYMCGLGKDRRAVNY